MGWLDKLIGKPEPVAAAAPVDAFIRDGIHHEFFIDEPDAAGRYAWLCRVYDRTSTAHQMTGSAESNQAAAQDALAWAEAKKAELRRTA